VKRYEIICDGWRFVYLTGNTFVVVSGVPTADQPGWAPIYDMHRVPERFVRTRITAPDVFAIASEWIRDHAPGPKGDMTNQPYEPACRCGAAGLPDVHDRTTQGCLVGPSYGLDPAEGAIMISLRSIEEHVYAAAVEYRDANEARSFHPFAYGYLSNAVLSELRTPAQVRAIARGLERASHHEKTPS
jgi:hypothetical protein